MIIPWWLTAVCLVAAAGIAGWPTRDQRRRHRLVLASGAGRERGGRPGQTWLALRERLLASPRRTVLLSGVLAGGVALLLAGPVAAFAAGAYGAAGTRGLLRHSHGRQAVRDRRRRLDALAALAADLRAGLPIPPALVVVAGLGAAPPPAGGLLGAAETSGNVPGTGSARTAATPAYGPGTGATPAYPPGAGAARIETLALAAGRLAEQTGAPLADLLERIETDARTLDRGLAGAAAQAAGARATAWLLAGLPLGGMALGYGIGVDPLDVLLHTPIGAACAGGAILLQVAGLLWAERLVSGPGRAS
ncbi:hypothetical protein AB0J86_24285 [Micromonospora sp. NPDC049559]|uniref:type II secretion system F family protein n=1 Tax=Micromonospora sp. NPDC049559 TaxID=3155923 RepID=UPI0034307AD7